MTAWEYARLTYKWEEGSEIGLNTAVWEYTAPGQKPVQIGYSFYAERDLGKWLTTVFDLTGEDRTRDDYRGGFPVMDYLNELGSLGWELIDINTRNGAWRKTAPSGRYYHEASVLSQRYLFKRPVEAGNE